MSIEIPVILEEGAELPLYATEEAAGADLRAYLNEPLLLQPGQRSLVPTGLRVAIPKGYEMQVRPRSGLAFKHGVTVLNSPGTIDSDYRGEVKVLLVNLGEEPFLIEPGMRIAQLVSAQVLQVRFERQEELTGSARGSGGFGHTGVA